MKIYIVFDTECYVHGAYRNREDAMNHLLRMFTEMDMSRFFTGVGMAKAHLWWQSDGEEHHLMVQEVELR